VNRNRKRSCSLQKTPSRERREAKTRCLPSQVKLGFLKSIELLQGCTKIVGHLGVVVDNDDESAARKSQEED